MSLSPETSTISPESAADAKSGAISVFLSGTETTTAGNTDFHLYHHHDRTQIVYVVKGAADCRLNDQNVCLSQGTVLLIGCNQMHRLKARPDSEYLSILFQPEYVIGCGSVMVPSEPAARVLQAIQSADWYIWKSAADDPFKKLLLDQLLSEKNREKSCLYMVLTALLTVYLSERLPDPGTTAQGTAAHRFEQMVGKIEKDYQNSELSLNDIAGAAQVSVSEALRCFRKMAGITPWRYLTEYRIQAAAGMLQNTEKTVTEISYACGFSQPAYFGKVFRKCCGLSPGQYRKTLRKK